MGRADSFVRKVLATNSGRLLKRHLLFDSLRSSQAKAQHDIKITNEDAAKQYNERGAEIKKLEAALTAKGETIKGLENKLVASKAINEEGVKIKAEKQQIEGSFTSTKIELESVKAELGAAKKRFSELSEEKGGESLQVIKEEE